MTLHTNPILGVAAPRPRPTRAGATWVALAASLPAAGILVLAEALWRWLWP